MTNWFVYLKSHGILKPSSISMDLNFRDFLVSISSTKLCPLNEDILPNIKTRVILAFNFQFYIVIYLLAYLLKEFTILEFNPNLNGYSGEYSVSLNSAPECSTTKISFDLCFKCLAWLLIPVFPRVTSYKSQPWLEFELEPSPWLLGIILEY